jgi:hypothetical protein
MQLSSAANNAFTRFAGNTAFLVFTVNTAHDWREVQQLMLLHFLL